MRRGPRERAGLSLLVEHVMQAIASLADRVIVLHHGKKILDGPTADVLSHELLIGAYLGACEAGTGCRFTIGCARARTSGSTAWARVSRGRFGSRGT